LAGLSCSSSALLRDLLHESSHPVCFGGLCGLRHLVSHLRVYRLRICQLCVLGIGLTSLLPALVHSEELDTITVIAEPETQTGDVQHEEYAGSYQHIGKQELQRQDVNLGDILANETGVQFKQVGGLGTLTTATVRGASSAQTGVFLDGIMLNSAGNSSVDLSLLELLNLSSVDVYRGSAPAQLSQASIGGAINLRSLRANNTKPDSTASLTTGSFNTSRYQFAHRSSRNRWDLVAAASREQSDNRFSFIHNNLTPFNLLDDRQEKRNNAQVEKLSALSRIGFQWNKDTHTDVLVQAVRSELGIPEWLNSDDNVASYDTDALELQVVNRFDRIGNWNTSLSLFQHLQNNHYLDALSQVGIGEQDTHSNSKTVGMKTYWEHIGDQGTFSFNASIRDETLESRDERTVNQDYTAQRRALSSTVQYAYFAANDRLLVTPSIRLRSVNDNYNGISRLADNRRNSTRINTQIGLRFKKNDQLTLRTSVGKFVREPAFSELFGSRGLFNGNNKLRAEKGINADLGITYSFSPAFELNTAVFGSWRDELILLVFDAQGVGQSVNSGKANVFGLEIGTDWRINKLLTLRANTTIQESQNFSPNPALNKLELPGEARLSSHAKLQYNTGKTRLWFESNQKSDFYYDQTNKRASKAYLLHNAGLEYQWQHFSIGLTANNISNNNIQDFNGFPRPGRSYYFSINFRL